MDTAWTRVLADSMAKQMTEELIYNYRSFIAEFGGALGLFVGFSFLTVFDLYECLGKKCSI